VFELRLKAFLKGNLLKANRTALNIMVQFVLKIREVQGLYINVYQWCVFVTSYIAFSNALTVVEERAKAAAVQVIQDYDQETLIKLKRCWEL